MSDSVLVSLAVLKVNWDAHKKDYIENFVPFVRECLRLSSSEYASLPEIQKQLAQHFHLPLPQSIIKTILKRLRRRGCLESEARALRILRDKIGDPGFAEVRENTMRKYSDLINSFKTYCQENHQKTLTTEEAEMALEAYLQENQLQLLVGLDTPQHLVSVSQQTEAMRYLVGAFLQRIIDQGSYEWECFETIFKGHMLANAMYLPDISEANRRFKKTRVFCDTPILLAALGYDGKPYVAPFIELLELLRATRGKSKLLHAHS